MTNYIENLKKIPHSQEHNLKNKFARIIIILKYNIHLAKNKLYFKSFQNYKNNIKETWATISSIIRKNPSQVSVPEKREIDGVITEDKNAIVNNLNQYFANVGEETPSRIPIPDTVTYKDYILKVIHSRFNFEVITNIDTARIIENLTPKKSSGPDELNTIMVKHIKTN